MATALRAPVQRSATAPAVEGWERLLEQVGMKDIFVDDEELPAEAEAVEAVDVPTTVSNRWDRQGLERIYTADLDQLLRDAFDMEQDDKTNGNLSHLLPGANESGILLATADAKLCDASAMLAHTSNSLPSNIDSASSAHELSPRGEPSTDESVRNSPDASFAVTNEMESLDISSPNLGTPQMWVQPQQPLQNLHHPQCACTACVPQTLLRAALPPSQYAAALQTYVQQLPQQPQPQVPQPIQTAGLQMMAVEVQSEPASPGSPEDSPTGERAHKKRRRGHRGRGGKGRKTAEAAAAAALADSADEPFRA